MGQNKKIERSEEWYQYIDGLVMKFQGGDKEAGEELIEVFQGYLGKYYRLLKEGKINFVDKDSRRFISLFIACPETRKSLKRSRQSTQARAEAHKAMLKLRTRLSVVPDEDLRQELIVSLLTLAKRFKYPKKKKRNFTAYLYNSYRYELYRRVSELIKDPIAFSASLNVPYNDGENVTDEPNFHECIVEFEEILEAAGDDFGNNWIYGKTASEIFQDLDPFDRLILKLHYIDGLFDLEIAEKTGYHRNSIGNKRREAIEHIARRLKDESKEDH